MLGLRTGPLSTLLCIGAHCDDIEIGAGATVLRLVREHPGLRVVWAIAAAGGSRRDEAAESARRFLEGAGATEIVFETFEDGYLPARWAEVKAFVHGLARFAPDLVLAHHLHDMHQDHRLLAELTWNAFRDHAILGYEIPKWDGDLGTPNLYVPSTADDASRKIDLLMNCFPSQRAKHWFDDVAFRGLMRLRGLECNAPDGMAEAFHARKLVLG